MCTCVSPQTAVMLVILFLALPGRIMTSSSMQMALVVLQLLAILLTILFTWITTGFLVRMGTHTHTHARTHTDRAREARIYTDQSPPPQNCLLRLQAHTHGHTACDELQTT